MTGEPPALLRLDLRRAAAAIGRMLARPDEPPSTPFRRRGERIGDAAPFEVATQIDEEEAVLAALAEEAQKERFRRTV